MTDKLQELTDEELFQVLLCGAKPTGGYTIKDYAKEWNNRFFENGGHEVLVGEVDGD